MTIIRQIESRFSFVQRYQYRWMLIIAISWTAIDILYWIYYQHIPPMGDAAYPEFSRKAIWLRVTIVFLMSCVMSFLLMFRMRQWFRNLPLLLNIVLKTLVLFAASLLMNFLLQFFYSLLVLDRDPISSLKNFYSYSGSALWLLNHSIGWIVLFVFTQLLIESYEKYSPGVFWDILIGRYIKPKVQRRIVVFIDLKNSTTIAENLSSTVYFSFIRDFIYYVSIALLEYDGRIYQYVGDEIVVSWLAKPKNAEKCISALKLSDSSLKKNRKYFQKRYGFLPEFKAGIHVGEVTAGEIGIIKKDIAISGDTMNTAARIRTACNELNYRCLASKEFVDSSDNIKQYIAEELGEIDLKGKAESVTLYAIKI